jgi:hypothetical protein
LVDPLFDSSLVLLPQIIQVTIGAMTYGCSSRSFDRTGRGVVAIRGDAFRDTTSDGACGTKEGFCRCSVASLAQQDIDRIPIPIDRPVQVN